MKRYNLCVANYKNWLLNQNIIKLLDWKQVITKIVLYVNNIGLHVYITGN